MKAALSIIPHSRPTLGREEVQALAAVVESGHLAQGPRVEEFERGLAAFVGVQGGVAANSGSAALELALLALGVGPGDEVILPSYVCTALWLAVTRVGAQPRLVDIEPATYSIDPEEAAKAITSRTRAILVPHLFGLSANLTAVQSLGVPLIEDCAQALGATERGRRVGSVGAAAICSFYATKLLCTGEGGMMLSSDQAVLNRGRTLREYDEGPTLEATAFNRKMSDLQAAVGISQLGRLPSFLERRAAIAACYREALSRTGVDLPAVPDGRTHIYYRYVVQLPASRRRNLSLDTLLGRLASRGLQCRRPVFRPIHRYLGLDGFPRSETAMRSALSIPLYPSMTDEEVSRAAQILREELS